LRSNPVKTPWGEAVGTPSGALAMMDAQLAVVDADAEAKDRLAEDAQRAMKMQAVAKRIAALEMRQIDAANRTTASQWITHGDDDTASTRSDAEVEGAEVDEEVEDAEVDEEVDDEVDVDAEMVAVGQEAPGSARGSASTRSRSSSSASANSSQSSTASASDESSEPKKVAPSKPEVCTVSSALQAYP
jgi:hypothetical protein